MQEIVRHALSGFPGPWLLLDEVCQQRVRSRAELVLVTDRAVLVFARDRAAAAEAAVSLADFHAGCGSIPVLPVAMLTGERLVAQDPLPFPGAAAVIACSRLLLPGLLARVASFPSVPGFDIAGWEDAQYRPVPALLAAAAGLFARHDVAAIKLAESGRGALDRVREAVMDAVGRGERGEIKQIVFVTGAAGAGKTLCGLDLAFAPLGRAAFLTGNPALLHVLRAALVRDAAARGLSATAARQRVCAVIQPLHAFRDHYAHGGVPPDRMLVIDEAQRCWAADYAVRKTANKPVPLRQSEPGHVLEIMDRLEGACTIVCLVGGGQEIHAGEGGIAEWGAALAVRPHWYATAPPEVLTQADPRQHLPPQLRLRSDERLHLVDAVRTFASPRHVSWVDAMLDGDAARARAAAGADLPVRVTRSLAAMRHALIEPGRRAGLVASAGGRRLRAEGLGGLLWHQDEDAVARWFLETWPDIRSSDALEVAATEFGIQGLELDQVGVCWDLDLFRDPRSAPWSAQGFRANAWTRLLSEQSVSNKRNAYRVLLTRARRHTVIWVPRGDARDATRDPARYDAIADFLGACGVLPLDESRRAEAVAAEELVLL